MWNVIEAMDRLVGDRFSQEMKQGLLAAPLLLARGVELRLSDVEQLVIPGLSALGIDASMHLFESLETLAVGISRRTTPHAFFTLNKLPIKAEPHIEDVETLEAPPGIDPIFADIGLVRRQADVEDCKLLFKKSSNSEWTAQPTAFESRYWALMTMKRSRRAGYRNANITACLLRWIAFVDANTDRAVTAEDADQVELAALFLSECAGSNKTPTDTRLRRSASAFRSANTDEAFAYLRQAVLIRLGLSAALRTALTRPVSSPLTDMERRELIYLARAGTSELKVLAVHRLAIDRNCGHPDVQITLHQMRYDSNPWVRQVGRSP